MAITAVNATYSTAGPTASGQILAPNELTNLENSVYVGTATATLDGTSTNFVLNYIDGTATLPFTPSAVEAQAVGGTQLAATPIGVVGTSVTDNKKCTVYLTGAGTASNTLKVFFRIVK